MQYSPGYCLPDWQSYAWDHLPFQEEGHLIHTLICYGRTHTTTTMTHSKIYGTQREIWGTKWEMVNVWDWVHVSSRNERILCPTFGGTRLNYHMWRKARILPYRSCTVSLGCDVSQGRTHSSFWTPEKAHNTYLKIYIILLLVLLCYESTSHVRLWLPFEFWLLPNHQYGMHSLI